MKRYGYEIYRNEDNDIVINQEVEALYETQERFIVLTDEQIEQLYADLKKVCEVKND